MTVSKDRIDRILVDRGLVSSRQKAKSLIMMGNVRVDQQIIDKPGALIPKDADVVLKSPDLPFVSRGGVKLEAALKEFGINVVDKICLDVGASTGGFTDCLLQRGAQSVYAVDVGYGQLAWKLRSDARVIVIERTNIRYLPASVIQEPIDLATIDVSFISLKIVVPAIQQFLKKDSGILALIKPQFEVGKSQVGKGGVVRDPKLHDQVISELSNYFRSIGLSPEGIAPSPIKGPKGNQEFMLYLKIHDFVQ